MLFGVADVIWEALIAGFVTIALALIVRRSARKTAKKLVCIAETGEAIHTLVNNAMSVQLKLNAQLSRRLAVLTGDTSDREAAEMAERLDREHNEKQALVDAQNKSPDVA